MNQFLVLGGNSILAQHFKRMYPEITSLVNRAKCDITSKEEVEKIIRAFPGKYVFNCAAITDVELCQKDPTLCLTINTTAVYILNELCLKYGKKLIHMSSDYAVNPVNTYGWSKHLSEQIVDPKFLTIRTNFYNPEKTFVIKELMRKHSIRSYKNMFFNPISVNRLVKEIYRNRNRKGILNIFSRKKISYFDFAVSACKTLGLEPKKQVMMSVFTQDRQRALRPLTSYVKSDINVDVVSDLTEFHQYISHDNK